MMVFTFTIILLVVFQIFPKYAWLLKLTAIALIGWIIVTNITDIVSVVYKGIADDYAKINVFMNGMFVVVLLVFIFYISHLFLFV
jgi:hypothetical protein